MLRPIRWLLHKVGISGDMATATMLVIAGFTIVVTTLTTLVGWVADLNPVPQRWFFVGVAIGGVGTLVLLNKAFRVSYGFAATKLQWLPQTKAITREVARLTEELEEAIRQPDLIAVETAARRVKIEYADLEVAFGVERELRFKFRAHNYSLAFIRFTGRHDGQLASKIEGSHTGKSRVSQSNVFEERPASLELMWEMSGGLTDTLSFYAERTDPWVFDFSQIRCEAIATRGNEAHTFWIPMPGETLVNIPEHPGFDRARQAYLARSLPSGNTEDVEPD